MVVGAVALPSRGYLSPTGGRNRPKKKEKRKVEKFSILEWFLEPKAGLDCIAVSTCNKLSETLIFVHPRP